MSEMQEDLKGCGIFALLICVGIALVILALWVANVDVNELVNSTK